MTARVGEFFKPAPFESGDLVRLVDIEGKDVEILGCEKITTQFGERALFHLSLDGRKMRIISGATDLIRAVEALQSAPFPLVGRFVKRTRGKYQAWTIE